LRHTTALAPTTEQHPKGKRLSGHAADPIASPRRRAMTSQVKFQSTGMALSDLRGHRSPAVPAPMLGAKQSRFDIA
jgi:hypothetical protein